MNGEQAGRGAPLDALHIEGTTLALVAFATAAGTAACAAWVMRRMQSPTAPASVLLFLALSVWLVAQGLEFLMRSPQDRILASKLAYLGIVFVPLSVLFVAARATRRDRWIDPTTRVLVSIVPVCSLLLVWSNELHGWIWDELVYRTDLPVPKMVYGHGPAFWVLALYSYALLGIATVMLVQKYRSDWRRYGSEAALVLSGMVVPWVANIVYLSGLSPLPYVDLTPYGFTLTAGLVTYGLVRLGILEPAPVSRSTVVQELGDGLLVLDRRGRVVDANGAACDILGIPDSVVHGLRARDVLVAHPRLLTLLEEASDGASSAVEVETPGGRRSFDVRVLALHERREQNVGTLLVLRDVTDYLRATEAAEAAAVAKSQFLANMSHEIRTPINGVLGLAQDLARQDLPADARETVDGILHSADLLVSIVDDVLDFSKLEAGEGAGSALEETPFEVRRLAADLVGTQTRRAADAGIALELSVAESVPDWLAGDEGRIRQVLTNLLTNAVKFTEQGGVQVRVGCDGAEYERVWIRFEVEDTGVGIPQDEQAHVFEPFTQADASLTRRFGGTGIGLAICRRLVAQMRGELGLHSEEGRGSRFWFVLPLAVVQAEDKALAEEPPPEARPAASPPEPPRPALRVLAVEDNAVNQRVVERLLRHLGCEPRVVADGAAAVEAVRAEPFDLVLMDCQMPGMDGFAATRAIRGLESERARVPIVALTAHAMAGDRERCLEAGMDDYLSKPVRLAALQRVVEHWSG